MRPGLTHIMAWVCHAASIVHIEASEHMYMLLYMYNVHVYTLASHSTC